MNNKSVLVTGGGWAGISAAVDLADRGFKVTLLEQSTKLGGRASSFTDDKTGDTLDNGQHLFMGCYTSTIRLLRKLGTLNLLKFQKGLQVEFVDQAAQFYALKCLPLPAPLHLFSGILRLGTLSPSEKLKMVRVWRALRKGSAPGKTVTEWLTALGQSEKSQRHLWDLITLATLNEQPNLAEADALITVLKEAFFSSPEKSQMAMSTVGLSDLCGPPAEKFIQSRGGSVQTNKLVKRIQAVGDQVRGIVMRDGSTLVADYYISAVPFFVLKNLLPGEQSRSEFFAGLHQLKSSMILSISLWFDRRVIDKDFVGMLDTKTHWLFNKGRLLGRSKEGDYLALVISGAQEHAEKTNEQILELCLGELRKAFPSCANATLKHSLVVREKNATLSPRPGYNQWRPSQRTPLHNFFLAGDWTATGLPATIESAVLSGAKAAALVP